jgi:acyl-coenzyme A synthetase/AMP-(fatty) acid ligase
MRSAPSGSGTFASFIDAILFHAVKAPYAPAIGLESGVLTYGQLTEAIFSATDRCRKIGLAPGSLVALIITDPVWHVCLIAALYRLGIASVSIGTGEAHLFSTLTAVLHDGNPPDANGANAIVIGPDWFTARPDLAQASSHAFGAADLCRIALSSGTTGQAKPIALSPQIIWDRLTTYSLRGRFAASERIYCGPQLGSQFGFAITFAALAYGKMVCFSDSVSTAIPVMSIYKTDLAIISVYQLNGLVDVHSRNYGGLEALREIQAGGSLISDALLHRARSCLAASIVSAYASTEAGTVAFAPVEQLGEARAEGAVGFVTPWASVEICDDEDRVLPPGHDGIIRVRTLGLAPHYQPGMTRVETSGPFYPGDFGRLLPHGMLVVAGRSTEVINIGGNKIAPERFENLILQCAGVKDAAVFTVDINSVLPQVWAAVVGDPTMSMAEIIKRCADAPLIGAPTVIKAVKDIPRNSAGKILRDQLRKQLTST